MALTQSGMDENQQRQQLKDEMEKTKVQCDKRELSVEELKKAELDIIHYCQRQRYPFSILQKG